MLKSTDTLFNRRGHGVFARRARRAVESKESWFGYGKTSSFSLRKFSARSAVKKGAEPGGFL
jgi:hypothetical protein